jgi:hypothetical protein
VVLPSLADASGYLGQAFSSARRASSVTAQGNALGIWSGPHKKPHRATPLTIVGDVFRRMGPLSRQRRLTVARDNGPKLRIPEHNSLTALPNRGGLAGRAGQELSQNSFPNWEYAGGVTSNSQGSPQSGAGKEIMPY